MDDVFDIAIIGAGLSGLMTGALLSKQNKVVCVVEKNPAIGGAIQPFKRNGIMLDTGMNFFGGADKGQIQHKLFDLIGINNSIHISKRKDTVFSVHLKGKTYNLPSGFSNFESALISYFPEEKIAVKKYIKTIKEIYSTVKIESLFDENQDFSAHSRGAMQFINSLTNNIDLKNILFFNNLLYSEDKNSVSLYLHAVISASYIDSCFEFTFGTSELIQSLQQIILESGGVIYTGNEVTSLETIEKKLISCTTSKGKNIKANTFISSLHPTKTLLLTNSKYVKKIYRDRINNLRNSSGSFLVWFIFKEKKFPFLNEINFIFNENSVWPNLKNGTSGFLYYTPFSSKNDSYSKSLKVMKFMEYGEVEKWSGTKTMRRGSEYELFKKKKVYEIINELEKIYPGFEKMIDTYYSSTPLTFESYTATPQGSMYGIVHDHRNFSQSIIPVRTKLQNLFLTGQSVHFHGMLGVSITSCITSSIVSKKFKHH